MKRLIRKSHFDNVNSMRFLAFLGIFASHAIISFDQQIRVSTLFSDLRQFTANLQSASYSLLFILTGFLNTWSIFEERFIYKKMNVLRFFMRRILGILPLYLIAFLLGNYIIPILNKSIPPAEAAAIHPLSYFSFSFNYGYEETWNPLLGAMGNMWSIAVTIQFLVVWPFLMRLFRRQESTLFVLLLLIYLAATWFFRDDPSWSFSAFRFIPEFVAGAFVAYISFFKYPSYQQLKENTRRTVGFTYLCFFSYLVLRNKLLNMAGDFPEYILLGFENLVIAGTLAYFLFEQNFASNSVLKLAKLKFMEFPGKISYGLYVYMSLGIVLAFATGNFLGDGESLLQVIVTRPLIALTVTIVIAVFSHEYLEKKFLRRKKNYNPTREYNPVNLNDAKT